MPVPARPAGVTIGLTVLWIVFWLAAILVAVWTLGGAALAGDLPPALFLLLWIGGAGFALAKVARQLLRMIIAGRAPPRPLRNHGWDDGIGPPGP